MLCAVVVSRVYFVCNLTLSAGTEHVPEDKKQQISETKTLRDFYHGRYESVLSEFDKKRAAKRGVRVPTPSKQRTRLREKEEMRVPRPKVCSCVFDAP